MINYLKKSLALISILLTISSCEKACYQPYEFDTEFVSIDSKPTEDGITGSYKNVIGGQVASWHDSGLRSDGGPIKLSISGSWTAWNSAWEDRATQAALDAMKKCSNCAKKTGAPNCICEPGQVSTAILDSEGNPTNNVCDDEASQNDPKKCTCTTHFGSATDPDAHYFATDYQNSNEELNVSDRQNECKYTQGLGLYLGMFGSDGNEIPNRIYHLYSTTKTCDVPVKDGECKDSDGNDIYRYIYTSPNNQPFIKDDKAGNDGSPFNPANVEFHKAGERIKLIINDVYYDDNYGFYNVVFLSGVLKAADPGLLELIVGSFEDIVIGKINADGKRVGGAVEFLYKSIVQDSVFIRIVQTLLVLYITIFGIGVLSGVVEMSRKDLSKRIMKIALVIFFTSATSWYFYNEFVIGLFKNGMDSIIAMFMNLVDSNIDPNSLIVAAQMDRVHDFSSATRFSYVDLLLKKLWSQATSTKIMGLLFGTYYGLLTIPAIYALIAYFTYSMVMAAIVYVTAMLKLIFVIALGPLFILTSLFAQTEGMFKKWLAFMGARSLEILILFIILYMFLVLIYSSFMDLLSIGVCVEPYSIAGITTFNIPVSHTDKSFIGWTSGILKIGALIFMMRLILDKIPMFSDAMAAVGGVGSAAGTKDQRQAINSSAFGIANDVVGKLYNAGKTAIKEGVPAVTRGVYNAASMIGGATGATDKLSELKEKVPFRSPLSVIRDMSIDRSINAATRTAKAKGYTGKALQEEIRKETLSLLNKETHSNQGKATAAVLGIDGDAIARRLDEKLVKDPLKKIIEEEAKKLKSADAGSIKFGAEMREELKQNVMARAASELGSDSKTVEGYLTNMKGFMAEKSELSSSEAAKKFAGRPELQNKFLEHLQEAQVKKSMDYEEANKTKIMGGTRESIKNFGNTLRGKSVDNPKDVESNFIRKTAYEDKSENRGWLSRKVGIDSTKGLSVAKRINILDKFADKGRVKAQEKVANGDMPISGEQKNVRAMIEAKASGAMNFEGEARNKAAAVSSNYLQFGYKEDLNKVRALNKEELKKFNAGKSLLSKAEIEKNKQNGIKLANKKLERHARELGKNFKDIRDEVEESNKRLDIAGQDDGKAGPEPIEGSSKIFETLAKLSNNSTGPKLEKGLDDLLNEKGLDKFLDEGGLDNILGAAVKEDLKNYHAQNEATLTAEVASLRSKKDSNNAKIQSLKNKPNKTAEENMELDQAEYEYSKADTQLSVKQAQLTMVKQELTKVT